MILGGGYIAVEFASIFNGLGVDTTICIRGKKILKGFDHDVVEHLMNSMKDKGVKFITGKFPNEIRKENNLFFANFKKLNTKKFHLVMEAVGREANVEKLNVKAAKIKLSKNSSIIVDDYFQTSNKNIYAIGDVIEGPMLAHKAEDEGIAVAEIIDGQAGHVNYDVIPGVIYTSPEVATVGKTEEQLKKDQVNSQYLISFTVG